MEQVKYFYFFTFKADIFYFYNIFNFTYIFQLLVVLRLKMSAKNW